MTPFSSDLGKITKGNSIQGTKLQHSLLPRKLFFTTPNLSLKKTNLPHPKDFVRMPATFSSMKMCRNSTTPL